MSLTLSHIVLIFIAGAAIAFQAPINGALGQATGSGLFAATASFTVGTLALAILLLLSGRLPSVATLMALPWWIWIGGLLGAYFVWASLTVVSTIGVVTMVAAGIMGQLLAALFLDASGLFALKVYEISWQRVMSVILVGAGLVLSRY